MLNTRTKLQKPVRVGLIGAGKFGSMILSQARHIEGLIISAVADLDVEKAKESFNRVGWDTSNCFATSINDAMIKASNGELKGVLDINQKPLVSKDFNHNPHSSIFDVTQTQVIKGKFSRVLSWYDNEWGFSNRMCDTAIQIASLI